MIRKITSYFQLIRLPNVLTAAADSLAGWLLVMGSVSEPSRWLPLVSASMVLYAAGTALNDVFDVEIDRAERPGRPLPSGRISWRVALWLGGIGLALGPILAYASGSVPSAIVALSLALCILSYDAGLKHTWLGPGFMGGCRGLNLLLGMTHSAALGGPIGWMAAVVYGFYVAGITVVSRSEARGGGRGWLVTGLIVQDLAILGFCAVALSHQRFPHPPSDRPLIPLEGLLVLALVAMALNLAGARALEQPTPQLIQKTVKTGILSLVWLHVGVVAAVRGLEPAALIAVFWVPAYILGRWLYST
jgi:4-hydroxybenzoate polyprenyltransferase